MKSFHTLSLLILGTDAHRMKIDPLSQQGSAFSSPSPNYLDWFEHPSYNDADYADYYTRDMNNAVNAAELAGADYLVTPKNQYWVENWYQDSSMPIAPKIDWDKPTNVALNTEEKLWRQNHWVDELGQSVTETDGNLPLLKTKYQNLLKKLVAIEKENNVGRKLWSEGAAAANVKSYTDI